MSHYATTPFSVNGRTYFPPNQPLAIIVIDGCENEYLDVSIKAGRMPNLERMLEFGHRSLARGALPSFTNVNNASIVTGSAPSVTGISGNFFLNPDTNQEVMMNASKYMRCETILAQAAKAGRQVAMITAKDKLRGLLTQNMKGISFSAEKLDEATIETHGISDVEAFVGKPKPSIYSPEASLYVLWSGVALLKEKKSDFLYLSLTDYMQHKFAPETEESLSFYEAMDKEIGHLLELNCLVCITADHGMNAKNTVDGEPNILYLEDILKAQFDQSIKVICPITDPYVVHHGALGGYVVVHLSGTVMDKSTLIIDWLKKQEGISEVYSKYDAAKQLELPVDRIGDIIVLAEKSFVLGRRERDHDLSLLKGGLRSHGSRFEEMVPFILSKPLSRSYNLKTKGDLRSFDIFEFACNGVEQ